MILLTICIFFWDFYAGVETKGFGVLENNKGLGMFFVYKITYFNSLVVVLAIVKSEKFGMGFFVWLPYAVIGFFVEAYFELILTEVLINIWAVVGWCSIGLISGFSADLTYKFLKEKTSVKEIYVAGLTGVAINSVYFIGVILALSFFYKIGYAAGAFDNPASFLGLAYFGLPWMLINAFFGGFTAYALNFFATESKRDIQAKSQ